MAKRNKGSKILRFAVSGVLASAPLVIGCEEETAPNMPMEETIEEAINEPPEEIETTNEVLEPPEDPAVNEEQVEVVDDGSDVVPAPRTNMPRRQE